jgi:8-oxo-dGTP pyrophosphatase MutT (NUDIX family)
MTQILRGTRAARQGRLRLGCSAVLLDEARNSVLLTRRSDNGQWCLPGGMIEPGETVAEACEREFFEETGLTVKVERLVGVYSNPDELVIYPDGNEAHIVVLDFEVRLIGGQAALSAETTGIDWFPVAEALSMDLFHGHALQLRDALDGKEAAFVR